MNEINVVFHGLFLWWMASTPAYVLIPDATTASTPHFAQISAPVTAFAAGACPAGFTTTPTPDRRCSLDLNDAGLAGGVRIQFATDTPSDAFPPDAFCAVPPIQHDAPLELLPSFTPPSGSGNAAWMQAVGGVPTSHMVDCTNQPPGNCPRFVEWTVPASQGSNVVLVLGNLKPSGGIIAAVLNPGAEVSIDNGLLAVLHAPRLAKTKKTRHGSTLTNSSAEDWCFYFKMVTNLDETLPLCPGLPPIPPVCTSGVSKHKHGLGGDIQTIACSNSQYP